MLLIKTMAGIKLKNKNAVYILHVHYFFVGYSAHQVKIIIFM